MPEIVDAMPEKRKGGRPNGSQYDQFTDGRIYLFHHGVDYTDGTRAAANRIRGGIHAVLHRSGRLTTERVTSREFADRFYLQVVPR